MRVRLSEVAVGEVRPPARNPRSRCVTPEILAEGGGGGGGFSFLTKPLIFLSFPIHIDNLYICHIIGQFICIFWYMSSSCMKLTTIAFCF
jgi:hypothetical protein